MGDIHKILCEIQATLKAPKNQFNSFGKYNYRSCEDIVEAVKPLLHEKGLCLLMYDEVVCIGSKNYVKATACIVDGNKSIHCSAYARESETKKGMDDSQLTGSTSSYARKYALNGLFAIDDTKDADTMDNREPAKNKPEPSRDKQKKRDWLKELENASTENELRDIFKDAYTSTDGEEKAKIKLNYDIKKQEFKGE